MRNVSDALVVAVVCATIVFIIYLLSAEDMRDKHQCGTPLVSVACQSSPGDR